MYTMYMYIHVCYEKCIVHHCTCTVQCSMLEINIVYSCIIIKGVASALLLITCTVHVHADFIFCTTSTRMQYFHTYSIQLHMNVHVYMYMYTI